MALADTYSESVADVRRKLVEFAAAAWSAIHGVDDSAMEALVQLVVPRVQAGQLLVANLTSAYFAETLGVAASVDDSVTKARRVDPAEVYQRPIVTVRSGLAEKGWEAARAAGGRRLQSLVTTDLQLAKTSQARRSLSRAGVEQYRRVPKGAHTCALCLIASTQRYHVGRLMPIHPGCDCGVDVIPAGMELDRIDSTRLLNATHAKVEDFTGIADRGGRAVDYRKLLVTHEHGELGEVLAWRGQEFASAKGLPIPQLQPAAA